MKIRPPSVRARLTLWYAGVLALIVCIFSAGILHFVEDRLYAGLDTQLGRQIATIDKIYREEPAELTDLASHWGITLFHVDEGGSIRHQTEAWEREGLARALRTGDSPSPLSWMAPTGVIIASRAFLDPPIAWPPRWRKPRCGTRSGRLRSFSRWESPLP